MFNKQKKLKNVVNKAQVTPSLNMISEDTKLKGMINSQTDLRIAGHIEGEIACKGKLIITASAKIDGNITTNDADIAGQVYGTIKVNSKLILRKTAKIRGDIYTKSLTIEEGATLNGGCRIGAMEKLENIGDQEFAPTRKMEQM